MFYTPADPFALSCIDCKRNFGVYKAIDLTNKSNKLNLVPKYFGLQKMLMNQPVNHRHSLNANTRPQGYRKLNTKRFEIKPGGIGFRYTTVFDNRTPLAISGGEVYACSYSTSRSHPAISIFSEGESQTRYCMWAITLWPEATSVVVYMKISPKSLWYNIKPPLLQCLFLG